MWRCRESRATRSYESTAELQQIWRFIFPGTFIYSTFFAVAALGECIRPLCICIDLHRTKMRVKQQFDRKESLKMLLWLFLMECLARVHVTRLTVWQRLSNSKLHPTLQKTQKGSILSDAKSPDEQKIFFYTLPSDAKVFPVWGETSDALF